MGNETSRERTPPEVRRERGAARSRQKIDAEVERLQREQQPFYDEFYRDALANAREETASTTAVVTSSNKDPITKPIEPPDEGRATKSNLHKKEANQSVEEGATKTDPAKKQLGGSVTGSRKQTHTTKSPSKALEGWNPRKDPPKRAEAPKRVEPPNHAGPSGISTPAASTGKRPYAGLVTVRKLKAQKRSSEDSPRSAATARDQGWVDENGARHPPRWYDALRADVRGHGSNVADTQLGRLKTEIERCKSAAEPNFNSIRERLHDIAFLQVNEGMVRQKRMLHNENGLPQLFDNRYTGGVAYPFDIRADAEEMYNKWCSRVFETDLLRGIRLAQPKKTGERGQDTVDTTWPGWTPADYHGNGKLLNGQWWPLQICAVRDGAHNHNIRGINGRETSGCFSVVMSGGNGYENEDYGDTVHYCGTDSTDGCVTSDTKYLMENVNNKQPVRLIRSHNCPSKFGPEIGFRYDGLYDVVGVERLDDIESVKQRHRFRLERCAGQDPLRGDGSAKRPTQQEMDAYRKIRQLRGLDKSKNA